MMSEILTLIYMDVKPTNKWVQHIKDWASKNGMNYREAMRADACKEAYKNPVEVEVKPEVPEVMPEVKVKKTRTKKVLEPVQIIQEVRSPSPVRMPIVKKERVKRSPKMVPT